ncbi:MAG: TolC family protein, partial [Gemmatimonadota bacterium]
FIELERRLLASAEQRLETQRERLRVAAVNPEDVLGAEVDLANQQLAVERAVADARRFSLTLRQTMGIGEDIEFEAVGELPSLFDPSTLDADSLVGVALRTNPGVVQAAASVEEAGHGVDMARGARWPAISIGASVSRGMSLSSYELLRFREETVNPQNRTLDFSLSANWSPFTRFETSTQIEQAEVQAANAAETLREQRLQVGNAVRTALIDLRNRHQAVEIAERAAETSRERLEMAEERFSTGSLDFLQLQQIIDQASQAERQAVQARIDFAKAVATLEQELGTEVRR